MQIPRQSPDVLPLPAEVADGHLDSPGALPEGRHQTRLRQLLTLVFTELADEYPELDRPAFQSRTYHLRDANEFRKLVHRAITENTIVSLRAIGS